MDGVVAPPKPSRSTTEARSRDPDSPAWVLKGHLRTLWFVGLVVFGVQFVLLVNHSLYLWNHFDLTSDFGQYSQAWQQIATGHLNPYDTTYPWYYPHYGYPFYKSDLELIMWPLALLYWVWPHALDLLIVQDIALAGSGVVAFRWVLEHLQLHSPNRRFAISIGTCVLGILVLQPWTYWAASYDYHSEPLATLFTLLAGRDLWLGRRRGWIWVIFILMCGNVATSYVIALGVAALITGRHRWRMGLVLILIGIAWFGVVGLVHSGNGAAIGAYAYLADRTTVNDTLGGIFTIVTGMAGHPSIVSHVVASRWGDIYKFVGGVGTIGFFSSFGAVLSVVVLAPSALNSSALYVSNIAGSQNFMAVMATAVGIAMFATWITRRGRGRDRRFQAGIIAIAMLLVIGALVQTAVMTIRLTSLSGQTFARVNSVTAAELSTVSAAIPEQAETIVSQGVVGRFAQRRHFYPYFDYFPNGQTVPVFGDTVYVILVPNQGLEAASPSETDTSVAFMRRIGAHQISDRHGVDAFAWRVPKGQRTIVFPP